MKINRPYAQMMAMATAVVEALRPACERIEIAGSLRRRKVQVGDIELVALSIPILNLLGEPSGLTQVDALLSKWPVTITKNGRKYKQFTVTGTSGQAYQIDLFLPEPLCWSVVYMIRTGSSDFARRMVTAKSQGGFRPDQYRVQEGRVWENGKALNVPDERDLFDLWHMAYVEPENRG